MNYVENKYFSSLFQSKKVLFTIIAGFRLVHSSKLVKLEMVNELSLLYYIEGNDKSLKPYLLMSHLDVVPVETDKWDVPPFDGVIKDGYIYGRGALDLKDVVMVKFSDSKFWDKKIMDKV